MQRPEFSRTVPRELVHRASVAEVFVTSHARLTRDRYEFGAQLPRFHAFHSDSFEHSPFSARTGSQARSRPGHDPLLVFEVCRQASVLLAHQYLAVPFDRCFVLRAMRLTVLHHAALAMQPAPADVRVICDITRRYVRGGTLRGAELQFVVQAGRVAAVCADVSYSWTAPEAWARGRDAGRARLGLDARASPLPPGPRAEPDVVRRRHPFNVVIGPPSANGERRTRARLVVDTGHPSLFDHALDHVPAVLQLEAFRQLSTAAAGAAGQVSLHALSARFVDVVELDVPSECVVRAEPVGPSGERRRMRCAGTLLQRGQTAAEAAVDLSVTAPRPVVSVLPLGG
ncbi:ScbA/BarX family gamma-butyrolactone biosynthesis protein [Streptomyces sp. NPDC002004]